MPVPKKDNLSSALNYRGIRYSCQLQQKKFQKTYPKPFSPFYWFFIKIRMDLEEVDQPLWRSLRHILKEMKKFNKEKNSALLTLESVLICLFRKIYLKSIFISKYHTDYNSKILPSNNVYMGMRNIMASVCILPSGYVLGSSWSSSIRIAAKQ